MFQQRFIKPDLDPSTPWSPFAVALLVLLIPYGGAVLTVRNLQILRGTDARTARVQVGIVIGIFTLGLTILFLLAQDGTNALRQPSSDSTLVLSVGTAIASYLVQRAPFRSWRTTNARARTASWIRALATTVLYTIVILIATVCLFATVYSVTTGAIIGLRT